MFQRRMPEWLRHSPAPNVRNFAILAGLEAAARGLLISAFPIVMYRALGDAETVSEIYFIVGLISLVTGLLVPGLTRLVPRRWMYTAGAVMMIGGTLLAGTSDRILVPLGLTLNTAAVVVMFVCFNAYVMDYIKRSYLGALETQRLFYSGFAWTVGPFLGVTLLDWWTPLPFIMASLSSCAVLGTFWFLRLSEGKQITRAKAPSPNPLAYLPRFLAQPRLVAGWIFAVMRSCGWWVYIVYLPIFAVEAGYSDKLGGAMLSISNGLLFITPLMLRWMNNRSVRHAVRVGFLGSAVCFALSAMSTSLPLVAVGLAGLATFYLVLLDVCAGLPFLMAVKPCERTEMSAVYATYRDVSGIVTPGIGRLILSVAPLSVVFAATGVALGLTYMLASKLHPRLGQSRGLAVS